MNRLLGVVSLVSLLLLSGMLPLADLSINAIAQQPAELSDNPISDEYGQELADSSAINVGDYVLFSHTTDEMEINETEYDVYYFNVNQNMLGATAVITLDTVDEFWSFEPDLDLYLYDTYDNEVASSETEGDETEVITIEFNQTGIWWVTVDAYEGDGSYILYRDVYSNSPPEIITENLNTENPYVHDPVLIDACDSYDADSHDFDFYWYVDGIEVENLGEDGNTSCDYDFEIDSLQPITVKVEAIDEYGLMSEEQITISPSDPGWNVKAIGNTIAVDPENTTISCTSGSSSFVTGDTWEIEITKSGLDRSCNIVWNGLVAQVFFDVESVLLGGAVGSTNTAMTLAAILLGLILITMIVLVRRANFESDSEDEWFDDDYYDDDDYDDEEDEEYSEEEPKAAVVAQPPPSVQNTNMAPTLSPQEKTRLAVEAGRLGVMQAIDASQQGASGWYVDVSSEIQYWNVGPDGSWTRVS